MLVRVAEAGGPAFRLRPGEAGISVFDTEAVIPGLQEQEILSEFRPGSLLIGIDPRILEKLNLRLTAIEGAPNLSERLRRAHAEIRPAGELERHEFKRLLRELEEYVH
jgi:hypothetical protein